MDTAMRDLGRIEEREPHHGPGRRVATLSLAAVATLGLVLAVGSLLGGADGASAEAPEDPLAMLDRAAGLTAEDTNEDPLPAIDRENLQFPDTLLDDGRPEVAAALAAVAAELEHPDPILAPAAPLVPPPSLRDAVASTLPAGAEAADAADTLARAAIQDPMVAAALPAATEIEDVSPAGEDGLYTIQVISYRTPAEAQRFALSLRRRGHRAFVTDAEVPDRGHFWRVRIGPFDDRRDAASYRSSFEQDENMNTIVIRRRD